MCVSVGVLSLGLGKAGSEAAGEVLVSPGQGEQNSPVSSHSAAQADVTCLMCHSGMAEEHPLGWNNRASTGQGRVP